MMVSVKVVLHFHLSNLTLTFVDQYIDPLKVDVFVTTLLNVASKSMTHCFASIAR